jgi:hypothetical protein
MTNTKQTDPHIEEKGCFCCTHKKIRGEWYQCTIKTENEGTLKEIKGVIIVAGTKYHCGCECEFFDPEKEKVIFT